MTEPAADTDRRSELSGGARPDVLKWCVGGFLALIVSGLGGVAMLYGMHDEMQKTYVEFRDKEEERRMRTARLYDYLAKAIFPAFQHSADRLLQLKTLDWKSRGLDPDVAQKWHRLSTESRAQASDDLGKVSGVVLTLVPKAETIKVAVEKLLAREIAAWKRLDAYVDGKGDRDSAEKAFGELEDSLMNYRAAMGAYAPILQATGEDGIQGAKAESQKDQEAFNEAMAKLRERKVLGALMVLGSLVGIVGVGLYYFWPMIRKRQPSKRIIIADR